MRQQIIDIDNERMESLRRRQFSGCQDSDGATDFFWERTLFKAAKRGDTSIFIDVLERFSNEKHLSLDTIFMRTSPSRRSLLHEAVGYQHKELSALIASHFPFLLASKDMTGDTPLHVAASIGDLGIARLLVQVFDERFHDLASGEDSLVKMKNELGNTALHEAVMNAPVDVVEYLVSRDLETWYYQNGEGKSPIYLAIQTGELDIVNVLLNVPVTDVTRKLQGHSPVHAAIMERRKDMLEQMYRRKEELFHLKDATKRNPLHLAAVIGWCEGIIFLLGKYVSSALEYDEDGYLPIHLACSRGRLHVFVHMMMLLSRARLDVTELLDCRGRNILHVAAMNGKHVHVRHILRHPELEALINARDHDGNTCLHLAAIHVHPIVLLDLTSDERVDLKIVNKQCRTARDIVDELMLAENPPMRERIAALVLIRAGAPQSKDLIISQRKELKQSQRVPNKEIIGEWVKTRLLVSTLVATVTFAAGFTFPGGYNGSDSSGSTSAGTATMLSKPMFQFFVVCDSIAMYSSILAVVILLWAQVGNSYLSASTYAISVPCQFVSLVAMCLAFMSGILVSISKLTWLAKGVIITAVVFITMVTLSMACYLLLYLPMRLRIFRQVGNFILVLFIIITGSSLPAQHFSSDTRPRS